MSEVLSGAQVLCRLLEEQRVEVLFGYPGGAIMPFYHALPETPGLRHILVRHEQAAAHAADGYARASGRPGVCVATSGPGATNLVTGIATAQMDSSPVVAITGQVPRGMIGRDAFQETDVVGITLPITKHSVVVDDITELAEKVREAFAVATEGRPGPVLIDIPKDVQNQKMEWAGSGPGRRGGAPADPPPGRRPPEGFAEAVRLLNEARRPLLMVGHGVVLAGAYAEVRALAEKTGIPVVTTLLGISAFPESHPLHLGMPGMHGEVHVNRAIQQADVILAIGLRFDDRVTGNTAGFAPQARIIHLDLDRTEIGKNIPVAVGLVGDARQLTARLVEQVAPRSCEEWRAEIRAMARARQEAFRGEMAPETILAGIREASGAGTTIVSDVGQHQMWVAKLFGYEERNSHITSGGLGTMGFAVPAAMGVHFARPDRPVWAISGDGGFQMNMQEMATMVQEGVPVKMAIFNNGYLGMVRQWQQFFHGRRYSATPIWSPDYVKLAEAYGIAGYRVERAGQVEEAVARAIREPGPALVEFLIEQEANVFPMIPPGGSLSEPIESAPAAAPAP
ncbi:MAG: biosynthetic-type acetolactate synthase large subunit [Gemmatimonadetes bacterium]|nr:biosynthetic-type acetolactate synthase large subunit [Gemmatimonadota bacterium]MBK7785547.1 biosynthetic-type acetolactate synthase large subunit [Gemmatimonadota bacterium]MBK9069320.1 biosynthetic-type acetolactate synthase large subunit [Gemmatimonadota bacterium]